MAGERQQRPAETVGHVDVDRCLPGHEDVADVVLLLPAGCPAPAARARARWSRRRSGRPTGSPGSAPVSPPLLGVAWVTATTSGHLLDGVGELADRVLRVGAGDDVRGDRQWRVVALAERCGDLVVGLPLASEPVGAVLLSGRASRMLSGRHGARDRAAPARATMVSTGNRVIACTHVSPKPARCVSGFGGRLRLLLGFSRLRRPRRRGRSRSPNSRAIAGTSVSAISTATVTAAAAAETHHGQDRDARHGQPGERDHHRGAGEHDGAAGRGEGARHRLDGRQPFAEMASVARQDEQRVVDAHGQPEHLGERRRVARHGRQRRDQHHRAQRHADADQRR